jgi:anti-sigma regulatory factor (Ser/Thr protein kinase)
MTDSGGQSILVVVDEVTQVGDARRRAALLADQLGFDEIQQAKAALIATEAANNLVIHAGGGELLLKGLDLGPTGSALEILALDSGPGMSDVGRCLADGYSSAGTPGTGLGAIRRIAHSFDIYSAPGKGTAVWARLNANARRPGVNCPGLEVGVTAIAAPGEPVCGDNWATVERDGVCFVLVVDGLGHGAPAALASAEAVRVFRGHRSREPADIVESAHLALRATRGAALAITRIDLVKGEVRYAGVGNISGMILDTTTGESVSMVSQNGTVGYTIRKIQSFDYMWTQNSLLLMHSDGLATHWSLSRYAGIMQRHPSLIAGVLYRDHKRNRDDVTVLVARPGTRVGP